MEYLKSLATLIETRIDQLESILEEDKRSSMPCTDEAETQLKIELDTLLVVLRKLNAASEKIELLMDL